MLFLVRDVYSFFCRFLLFFLSSLQMSECLVGTSDRLHKTYKTSGETLQ